MNAGYPRLMIAYYNRAKNQEFEPQNSYNRRLFIEHIKTKQWKHAARAKRINNNILLEESGPAEYVKYRGPIQMMRKGLNIKDVDRIKLDYSVFVCEQQTNKFMEAASDKALSPRSFAKIKL